MKQNKIVEATCFLLILLFLYTGLSKYLDFKNTKLDFNQAPIIGNYATSFAIVIPLAELTLAIGLFFSKTRKAALLGSFILMFLFTGYVAYMLTFLSALERPCSCGGIMRKMSWQLHLYFNLTFTLLSLLAFILDNRIDTNSEELQKS